MSDFMNWFCIHYIRPYIKSQPQSNTEKFYLKNLESLYSQDERNDIQAVLDFYAVHAFRLGMKMGAALVDDLGKTV